MAARSIQESIALLENKRRRARDEIDLRKMVIKKFPNSSITIDQIDDGTLVMLCDAVNPSNSTGIHYVYHPIHNYYIIRPYITVSRKKSFTKIFSPNAYKVGRMLILEALNTFGTDKKCMDLPESYHGLFGTLFNSKEELKNDTAFTIASEHAVPEPEVKDTEKASA